MPNGALVNYFTFIVPSTYILRTFNFQLNLSRFLLYLKMKKTFSCLSSIADRDREKKTKNGRNKKFVNKELYNYFKETNT